MILLNPKKHNRYYPDKKSRDIMLKTIDFFESKGKGKLKALDGGRPGWGWLGGGERELRDGNQEATQRTSKGDIKLGVL